MTNPNVSHNPDKAAELITEVRARPELAAPLLELLREVGSDLTKLSACTTIALDRLRDLLPEGSLQGGTPPQRVDRLAVTRENFLSQYKVACDGESRVTVTLPEGVSRYEFLVDAQKLAPVVAGRNAVYNHRLADWSKDPAFVTRVTEDTTLSVDRPIANHPQWDLRDLAIAHSAYLIATGKDLFQGKRVQAFDTGVGLRFAEDGIRCS